MQYKDISLCCRVRRRLDIFVVGIMSYIIYIEQIIFFGGKIKVEIEGIYFNELRVFLEFFN